METKQNITYNQEYCNYKYNYNIVNSNVNSNILTNKKLNNIKTNGLNYKHKVDFSKDDLSVSYYDNILNGFISSKRFKALDLILLSIVNSFIVTKFNKAYNGQTIAIKNTELQEYLGNNRIQKHRLIECCERLSNTMISFGDNQEYNFKFFTKANYINGYFLLNFNKDLSPFILTRNKNYTKVDNNYLFKLYRESNNAEAIRLYQYMSTFNGIIYEKKDFGKNSDFKFKKDFTFEELCAIIGINNNDVASVKSYYRDRNKDRIIATAIKHLNKSTNMSLELFYGKEDVDSKIIITNSIYMDIKFTQYDKVRPIAVDFFEHEINNCYNFGGYSQYVRHTSHGIQLKELFEYLKKYSDMVTYNLDSKTYKFTNGKSRDKIVRKFIHLFTNKFIENFNPIDIGLLKFKPDHLVLKFDKDYIDGKVKIQNSHSDVSFVINNLKDSLRLFRFSGIKFRSRKN